MSKSPKKAPSDEASLAREDEVLRRMLNTPPKPHKDKPPAKKKSKRAARA